MFFFIGVLCTVFASAAFADFPLPWQTGLQESASPMMTKLTDFYLELEFIAIAITLFVFVLLAYVCIRFNRKANPVPSKTTHNVLIEIIWTVVPVLILIAIAIPSMRVLYFVDKTEEVDMNLKVIGYQWYWGYQYPDHGNISFDSNLLQEDELKEGDIRLLSVDNKVVLPIGKNIRIQLTAADVIHAWAIPALGVRMDAVPGRLNETWVRIEKPGIYYGQCSELCGVGHGFMPIAVEAVSEEDFKKWVEKKKSEQS
ncbi:cytochrome c oxidase subunit II [Rickettsiales bacterium]|nr:cytochrome c oxidase subunit II [Rickettsiales bacterium]